jgi:putative DNA primase/helicase
MPSKPVARVLSLLENIVENSSGWTALCPAHGDTVNSLSISEGEDGRVLLFCHAGCSFDELIAALGISTRSLFVQRRGNR